MAALAWGLGWLRRPQSLSVETVKISPEKFSINQTLNPMVQATWRYAKENDREFVFEAYKQALQEHVRWAWGWDEEFQRNGFWKHHPFGQFRVVEVAGQRAGGVHVETTDSAHFVRLIFLLPEFRGKGLGSFLLLQAAEQAKAEKKPLGLKVIKSNPAKSLYNRLGFVEVAQDEVSYDMRLN